MSVSAESLVIRPGQMASIVLLVVMAQSPRHAPAEPVCPTAFCNVVEQVSVGTDVLPLSAYLGSAGDDHGPGAAFVDLNNDLFPDLLVVDTQSRNFLYLNVSSDPEHPMGPDRRFELVEDYWIGRDAAEQSALAVLGLLPTGALAADFDNDGDLDLYLTNSKKGAQTDSSEFASVKNYLLLSQWVESGGNIMPGGAPAAGASLHYFDHTDGTDMTPASPDNGEPEDPQHGLGFAYDIFEDPMAPGVIRVERLDDSCTAVTADVDRDGDLDVYVGNTDKLNGNAGVDPDDTVTGNCNQAMYGQRDVFYLNRLVETGQLIFEDVTMDPSLAAGDDPLTGLVGPNGETYFIRNETTAGCGNIPIVYERYGSSNAAIFADLNNDEWPDLLVTNIAQANWYGDRAMLYLNLGADAQGQWRGFKLATYLISTDVSSAEVGTARCATTNDGCFGAGSALAMGVDVGDFDNDGDLDIYIADDRNDLWINRLNDGEFDIDPSTGLVLPHFHWDRDTVPNNQYMDVMSFGWGVNWVDFDNDGFLDLHVTNDPVVQGGSPLQGPSRLYMNRGSGAMPRFKEMAWCLNVIQFWFGASQFAPCRLWTKSHGNPSADYNLDGWMDLFVVRIGPNGRADGVCEPGGLPPSSLFLNQFGDMAIDPCAAAGCDADCADVLSSATAQYGWLRVKLIGDTRVNPATGFASSRDALGARLTLHADLDGNGSIDGDEIQTREVHAGSGNATTTDSLWVHFGVGLHDESIPGLSGLLEITWPSGRMTAHGLHGLLHAGTVIAEACESCGCPGDSDCDGDVDFADLTLVLGNFGRPTSPGELGDLNCNGSVAIDDLASVLGNFGSQCE